jgi:hypothetical protein
MLRSLIPLCVLCPSHYECALVVIWYEHPEVIVKDIYQEAVSLWSVYLYCSYHHLVIRSS